MSGSSFQWSVLFLGVGISCTAASTLEEPIAEQNAQAAIAPELADWRPVPKFIRSKIVDLAKYTHSRAEIESFMARLPAPLQTIYRDIGVVEAVEQRSSGNGFDRKAFHARWTEYWSTNESILRSSLLNMEDISAWRPAEQKLPFYVDGYVTGFLQMTENTLALEDAPLVNPVPTHLKKLFDMAQHPMRTIYDRFWAPLGAVAAPVKTVQVLGAAITMLDASAVYIPGYKHAANPIPEEVLLQLGARILVDNPKNAPTETLYSELYDGRAGGLLPVYYDRSTKEVTYEPVPGAVARTQTIKGIGVTPIQPYDGGTREASQKDGVLTLAEAVKEVGNIRVLRTDSHRTVPAALVVALPFFVETETQTLLPMGLVWRSFEGRTNGRLEYLTSRKESADLSVPGVAASRFIFNDDGIRDVANVAREDLARELGISQEQISTNNYVSFVAKEIGRLAGSYERLKVIQVRDSRNSHNLTLSGMDVDMSNAHTPREIGFRKYNNTAAYKRHAERMADSLRGIGYHTVTPKDISNLIEQGHKEGLAGTPYSAAAYAKDIAARTSHCD